MKVNWNSFGLMCLVVLVLTVPIKNSLGDNGIYFFGLLGFFWQMVFPLWERVNED